MNRKCALVWVALSLLASPLPAAEELRTQFVLAGESGEFSSTSNGAEVTPKIAPAETVGNLVVRGSGSMEISSDGLAFLKGGQQNSNVAFLRFTGDGFGRSFDLNGPGEVSFVWTSRYSLQERTALITDSGSRYIYRTAFEVANDVGVQLALSVTVHDGLLAFICTVGPTSHYLFIPKGSEDAVFGKGVKVGVSLTWDGQGKAQLSLNGKTLGPPFAYQRSRQVWSGKSNFVLGATTAYNGGYYASDDSIKDFVVKNNGPLVDTTPPVIKDVSLGSLPLSGLRRVRVSASDDGRLQSISLQIDGSDLATLSSYPYAKLLDFRSIPNGSHTLTVIAKDVSSNTSKANFEIVVANAPVSGDARPPGPVLNFYNANVTSSSITLTWEGSEDDSGIKGYRLYRDGVLQAELDAGQPGDWPSFVDPDLKPGTAYRYQIESMDLAGNVSYLSAPLELTTKMRDGDVLRVGPNGGYQLPCQAFAAAREWDTVEIDALGNGSYDGDVCSFKVNHLTIRGVNGRAAIDASGRAAGSKAVWVIDGSDNIVENVEISGCHVPDKNGAAIRMQGPNLTLRRVYLHDNENGILVNGALSGQLLVEYSEFAYNGDGVGYSHSLYVSDIDKFVFRYSYSHHGSGGHLLKSRAKENHILYSRLTDEDGTASYEIDLPNGGLSYVVGNLLQQTAKTSNPAMVTYGVEGLPEGRTNSLLFVNNTLVDFQPKPYVLMLVPSSPAAIVVRNNLTFALGSSLLAPNAKVVQQGNKKVRTLEDFRDAANFDFSPLEGSASYFVDEPGPAAGEQPEFEYFHPASAFRRPAETPGLAGAFHSAPPLQTPALKGPASQNRKQKR